MGNLSQFFDSYSRRARLAPALIVVLPLIVACIAAVPNFTRWSKVFTIAVTCGLFIMIDQLVRGQGKRIEPALWAEWGGPPATQALRHRNAPNQAILARRHQQLEQLLDTPMPTKRQEQGNPAKADEKYEMAVKYLIARTRDTATYQLILTENCHYGFRRNLLGMRRFGLSASLMTAVGAAIVALLSLRDVGVWEVGFLLTSAVSLLLSFMWWKVVTPKWVREAANAYAERLVESLDVLLPVESSPPEPGQAGRP